MKKYLALLILFLATVPATATTYYENRLPLWVDSGDSFIIGNRYYVGIVNIRSKYVQLRTSAGSISTIRIDEVKPFRACGYSSKCEYYVWLSEIYNNKARMMVSTSLEDFRLVNVSGYRVQYPDLPCYPDGYNGSFYIGSGKYSLRVGDAVNLENMTVVFSESEGSGRAKLKIYNYSDCDYLGSMNVRVNQTQGKAVQSKGLMILAYGYSYKPKVISIFIITRPLVPWDFWRMFLWAGLIAFSLFLVYWMVMKWKAPPEEADERVEEDIKAISNEKTPFLNFLKNKEPIVVEMDEKKSESKEEE